MQLSIKPTPLRAIQLADTWNLHPWDLDQNLTDLAASFLRLGVIHPPVVLQSRSSFTPLAGYKRLLFYQSTMHSESDAMADCLVVPENTAGELLLDIILCDQQAASPLSLCEKARFVSIASNFLSEPEIIDRYFDMLLLKKRPSTFALLRDLLQQDELIIRETHADRIPLHMVESILQLKNRGDRVELVRLFKELNLGPGKQKKFFALIRDISQRKAMSIRDFLADDEIAAMLQHKEMNIPQIINNLGKILEQNLTPTYTLAEKEFSRKVQGLHLPSHYQLSHSPFFEKDDVTLSITFDTLEKCCSFLNNDVKLRRGSS